MIHHARATVLLLAMSCLEAVAQVPPPVSDLTAALRLSGTLQSRVRFDHLTMADGLSNDSVFSILQDRHGFLWFGTQAGLNRYDGYRITQYRNDPADPNSLPDDFVHNLLEDRRGAIWTGNAALSRFDPETGTFTRFALPRPDSSYGRPLGIQHMCEDRSGFLWLGMSGGPNLYRFDPGTGTFTAFDISASLATKSDHPIGMYADPSGILWLGSGLGLIRFDPTTGSSKRYTYDDRQFSAPGIRSIAQDRAGKLWLATTEGGQNFFDPVAGVFARRGARPNRDHFGTDTNAILAGADGVIWWGKTDGLAVVDPATGATTILRHNAADRFSLSANEIQSLAVDRDGSIWAGTKGGGVDHFSPASLQFGAWRRNSDDVRGLSDGNVRSIYCDRAGAVWLGTYDGGLNRFDPASGTFTQLRHDPRNPRSLSSDRVYSIYEDRSGDIWAGTDLGIDRLNRQTGSFTHFERGPLARPGVGIPTYTLFEDSRGGFWFGAGEGRARLDQRTGAIDSPAQAGGLSMLEDREGNLWFASASGLTRMEPSGKVNRIALIKASGADAPSTPQINFMHEDTQGVLWFASENGLLRYDPKSEAYTSYTTREGLPDNVVQCVLPDRAGNLWLSTNNGISRFNPRDNTFSNYHESDGLQGEQFNRKSCFADSSGVLYFGGLHGFNIFDPRRIPADREASRVVLTEFRIHGSSVPVQPGSLLPKPLWQMNELNLPPEDNGISFEFAALKFSDQARTSYRFMLEGLESKWTEVDSRNRSARYTGLRPRRYRFRVQASTDGKSWSYLLGSFGVLIATPWWMTPWSVGGMVLTMSGLLFGAYRLRVRSLQESKERLQRVVDQRTAALLEANREAEQARVQAESANRSKSVFLANMSHELRTPLSVILASASLLSESNPTADQLEDIGAIGRSGEHLLGLIDDVLDVAKIEAGKEELAIAACDLLSTVRTVVEMMRGGADEKHLTLVYYQAPKVPRYVRVDAQKLRQILINLLGNAIKFTREGTVKLQLSAKPTDEPGRARICFDIEDTGVGMPRHDLGRIFEPFEQVRNSGPQKGTGLGLTITRRFVELMGGTMLVESEVGRGSRFVVELPLELAKESETYGGELAPGHPFILESGQPECRVLIVEDDAESAAVLRKMLTRTGFQVRVAENGALGVEAFQQWRPHFIWMDVGLPRLNGAEATRRIRQLDGGAEVKIAAISASACASERDEVMRAGFDDFAFKPFRQTEIFFCMARHLGVRYSSSEGAENGSHRQGGERPASG